MENQNEKQSKSKQQQQSQEINHAKTQVFDTSANAVDLFGILFGTNKNINGSDYNNKNKPSQIVALTPNKDINGSNLRSSIGNWSCIQQDVSFKKGVSVYLNDSSDQQVLHQSKDNSCALSKQIKSINQQNSQNSDESQRQGRTKQQKQQLNKLKTDSFQNCRQILLESGIMGENFQQFSNQKIIKNNIQARNMHNNQTDQLQQLRQIFLGSNLIGSQIQQALRSNIETKQNLNKNKKVSNQLIVVQAKNQNLNMTSMLQQSKIITQKSCCNNNSIHLSDHFLDADTNILQQLLNKFSDLDDQNYQISVIQPIQTNCLQVEGVNSIDISHFQQAYINQNHDQQKKQTSMQESQLKPKFYESQKIMFKRKQSGQNRKTQKVKTEIHQTSSQILPIQYAKSHVQNINQLSPLQFLTNIIQKSQKNYVIKINGINISQWGKPQNEDNNDQQQINKKQSCITIQVSKCKMDKQVQENSGNQITSNVKNQCQKKRSGRKFSLPQNCKQQIFMFNSVQNQKSKRNQRHEQQLQKYKQNKKNNDIQFNFKEKQESSNKKNQQALKIKFLIKKIKKLQRNIQLLGKLQSQDKNTSQIQAKTCNLPQQHAVKRYQKLRLNKKIVQINVNNNEDIKNIIQNKQQKINPYIFAKSKQISQLKRQQDTNSKIIEQLAKMQQKIIYLQQKLNHQSQQRLLNYQRNNRQIQSSAHKTSEQFRQQLIYEDQSFHKQKQFTRSNGLINKQFQQKLNISQSKNKDFENKSLQKQPGRIIKKSQLFKLANRLEGHDAISISKNKIHQKSDSQSDTQKNNISEPWLNESRTKTNKNYNLQQNQIYNISQKWQSNQLKNHNHRINKSSKSNNFESVLSRIDDDNMLQFNTEKQKYFIDSKETEQLSKFLSAQTFQNVCKNYLPQIPNLPIPPTPQTSQQDLIQLGRCLFSLFQVDKINDEATILSVKKYKNCVYFGIDTQNNILWHYQGKIYSGGWKSFQNGQGQKFGQGIQYNPNKYLYSGHFNYGRKNGQGALRTYTSISNIYIGQFVEGLKHGRGKLIQLNGSIYEGQWKTGKKHGAGILHTSENQYYQGTFQNGLKFGYGVQKFKNGDSYKGQYKHDKFQGKGFYQWHNGSSYQGQFKNGKRNGYGVWKSFLKNYDLYEGYYLNDLKQGFGFYKWPNGSSYQGTFKADKKHGIGKTKYQNGKIANLIWDNGRVIKKISDEQQQKFDGNPQKDLNGKNKNYQKHYNMKDQKKKQSVQKTTPSSVFLSDLNNKRGSSIGPFGVSRKGSVKWVNQFRQKSANKQQRKQATVGSYRCKSSTNLRKLVKGDQVRQAQYKGVQSTINIANY